MPLPARRAALLLTTCLGSAGVLGVGHAALSQSDWRARLAPLLPSSQVVKVLETRSRLSVVELRRRVLEAGADQRAVDVLLSQAQNGQYPNYDPRLKISEADFKRYLVFQNELQPSGKTVKLSVLREPNRLTFGDAGGTALLRGISLDLSSGEMRFPEGFSAKPEAVYVTAAQAAQADDPLGRRSGFVWKVRGSNPTLQTALNGHFALLAVSSGEIVLSYSRNSIVSGRVSAGNLSLSFSKDSQAMGATKMASATLPAK